MLNTLAKKILVRAFPYALFEGSSEVVEVGIGDLGESIELEFIAEIGMDVVDDSIEA